MLAFLCLIRKSSLLSIHSRHKTETMRWRYVIPSFFVCLSVCLSCHFFFPFIDIYSRRCSRAPLNDGLFPYRTSSEMNTTLNCAVASGQQGCNCFVYRNAQEYPEGLLVPIWYIAFTRGTNWARTIMESTDCSRNLFQEA
jgi:hypothetical protein